MIDYRDATIADGPALDAMARKIWLETFGHSASPDDIALYVAEAFGPQGRLIASLADPAHKIRLAVSDTAIAGFAKLSPLWLTDPAIAAGAQQLSQLYVAQAWHGRGVAQALMAWTIDTARQSGASALVLTVWEDNHRAKAFYDRYGFVHIGDYAFPTGTQIDRDLIMQLML
ncbi:MAG: GNAT family N-acetyltransferase [Sphingomonas sp.]|nr:GNAT family N-acetyltransferase [Sphingomonas sp.]